MIHSLLQQTENPSPSPGQASRKTRGKRTLAYQNQRGVLESKKIKSSLVQDDDTLDQLSSISQVFNWLITNVMINTLESLNHEWKLQGKKGKRTTAHSLRLRQNDTMSSTEEEKPEGNNGSSSRNLRREVLKAKRRGQKAKINVIGLGKREIVTPFAKLAKKLQVERALGWLQLPKTLISQVIKREYALKSRDIQAQLAKLPHSFADRGMLLTNFEEYMTSQAFGHFKNANQKAEDSTHKLQNLWNRGETFSS